MLAQHLSQHRHETIDRVGWPPGGRGETLDRVVGAMDVGHSVHQIERRARFGHRSRILWRDAGTGLITAKGYFGAASGNGAGENTLDPRPALSSKVSPLRCLRAHQSRPKRKSRNPFPVSRDQQIKNIKIARACQEKSDPVSLASKPLLF
jgi:hypothetical protein